MDSHLNYEKMCIVVAENHARNSQNKTYGLMEACCEVESGYHFCCGTSSKSGFEKFGVGITLYFKFLKYLLYFFLFFMIISLPIMYLNVEGLFKTFYLFNSLSILAAINNHFLKITSYSHVLFTTTLGSLGYNSLICGQSSSFSNNGTISFDCGEGYLYNSPTTFALIKSKNVQIDGCSYLNEV